MSILDDTYFQLRERFITKEQWNKYLYFSRHLHREVNRYWPAYSPQRKLVRKEVEFRKNFGDTMGVQFEHDFYITCFSNQFESDETDFLQQRMEW